MLDDAANVVERVGAAMCILGTLIVVWQLSRRAASRPPSPAHVAEACTAFHRAELERQRDALAAVWRWYLGPLVPGIVTIIAGRALEPGAHWLVGPALLLVVAIVFAAVGIANRKAARALQQEIDALDSAAGLR